MLTKLKTLQSKNIGFDFEDKLLYIAYSNTMIYNNSNIEIKKASFSADVSPPEIIVVADTVLCEAIYFEVSNG